MVGKFQTFDDLDAILINRQKTECGENFAWMKIKLMRFTRGSLKMEFRWNMAADAEIYTVDFCRNKRAPGPTMKRLLSFRSKKMYTGGGG